MRGARTNNSGSWLPRVEALRPPKPCPKFVEKRCLHDAFKLRRETAPSTRPRRAPAVSSVYLDDLADLFVQYNFSNNLDQKTITACTTTLTIIIIGAAGSILATSAFRGSTDARRGHDNHRSTNKAFGTGAAFSRARGRARAPPR